MKVESERGVIILSPIHKERPIDQKYRKGKLKRTPEGELKDLKLSSRNHLILKLGVFITSINSVEGSK